MAQTTSLTARQTCIWYITLRNRFVNKMHRITARQTGIVIPPTITKSSCWDVVISDDFCIGLVGLRPDHNDLHCEAAVNEKPKSFEVSAFGGDDGLLPQARNPLEPNPFAICATRNEDFVTAALSFKHFKYLNSVTTEEKLRAFALIMQGAEGSPSQGIQIRFYELAAQYKLAAWKEVSHVSKEDAQTQLIAYIAHLTEKHSHTKPQYPELRRVDTHFHVIPDFYAKAVEENGGDPAHGVMSVTAPGAAMFSGEDGRKMARKINEWQSQLVQENASKLSSFASLPNFFDVEGTIAEVEFALGELGAVGVVVFTSYHQGSETRYLGHPSFAPILETINYHGPANMISKQLPLPIMDYPQETTRMAADLVTSGTTARFPNIKFILSHGGGTVPYLAQRIAGTGMIAELSTPLDYLQMMEEFRKFYYDV
ncbi:hypothetical protein BCR33DRAFT_761093 [Rhizoclosmatium globosum]|uniref:6-methylsalicylate decarboxylase n=1 Tax=Rhizoclosmatium globosum TaxID=329046 RepID=A0A1Y2D5B1_9FUNG|nr:hypothetical protein BCR33DRAFT_761093 [Rhizoclosmatium globosum]|eukprot:ORY53765.1 hypothetical protein BCR33DRAFT_761093 [Rhizoclosmatium globosum]